MYFTMERAFCQGGADIYILLHKWCMRILFKMIRACPPVAGKIRGEILQGKNAPPHREKRYEGTRVA